MVWLVETLEEGSRDVLSPVSAERGISFVVQCEDWSKICLSLTRNKGTTQPTITTRRVCVKLLGFLFFFFLSSESNAFFPSQRETFEKL